MSASVASVAGKVPANDLDAERLVLGWALTDPASADRALELLDPGDFYDPEARSLWASIGDLRRAGSLSTPEAVLGHMRGGTNKPTPRPEVIAALLDRVDGSDVATAAWIVRSCAVQRKAVERLHVALADGYARMNDRATWLDGVARDLAALRLRCNGPREITAHASALLALERAKEARGGRTTMVSTGIAALDEESAGLHAGEYVALTAKTGGGKTALACSIAMAAAKAGTPARIYTLEMPHEQLTSRMLCSEARVSWHDARRGRLRDDAVQALEDAMATFVHLPLTLVETARTIRDIIADMRRYAATHPGAVVVLDYAQLVEARSEVGRGENREREIAAVARALSGIARDCRLRLLVLAQLNDDGQVRESRALAHEATSWWDLDLDKGDTLGSPRRATVRLRKQRHGPQDTEAEFLFHPGVLRFTDRSGT